MSSAGTITELIGRLQAGDDTAAWGVWGFLWPRLLRLAGANLRGRPVAGADEQDAAQVALCQFFRGVLAGQYPWLHNRDDLWHLMAAITLNKVKDLRAREGRIKRNPHPNRNGPSALAAPEPDLNELPGHGPAPDVEAELNEACQQLLEQLGNARLRAIAILRMEGHSQKDIAAFFKCSVKTVERKIGLIRKIWSDRRAGRERTPGHRAAAHQDGAARGQAV